MSLAASTGTSAKDFWIVSNQVDILTRVNRRQKKRENASCCRNRKTARTRGMRQLSTTAELSLTAYLPPATQAGGQSGTGWGAPESKHANRTNRTNKTNRANTQPLNGGSRRHRPTRLLRGRLKKGEDLRFRDTLQKISHNSFLRGLKVIFLWWMHCLTSSSFNITASNSVP